MTRRFVALNDAEIDAITNALATRAVQSSGRRAGKSTLQRAFGKLRAARGQWPVETDAIHRWFSLSYAQYLTIPRTALQSMPSPWQAEMVGLLEQLDSALDWRPDGQYRVTLHDPDYSERDRAIADGDDVDEAVYWGDPIPDPLADYERGRRRMTTTEPRRKSE